MTCILQLFFELFCLYMYTFFSLRVLYIGALILSRYIKYNFRIVECGLHATIECIGCWKQSMQVSEVVACALKRIFARRHEIAKKKLRMFFCFTYNYSYLDCLLEYIGFL